MDRCGTPPTQRSRTFLAVLCSELTSHLLNLLARDAIRSGTQRRRGGAAHRRPEHYPPPASRQRPGEAQKRRVATIVDLFPFMWRFFTVIGWLKASGGVECSLTDRLRHHVPANSNHRHAAPGRTRLPAATRRGSPAALLRDEQLYVGAGRRSLCSSATNRSRFLAGGGAAPGFTLAETLGDGATPTAFGQSVPTHGRSVTAMRCLRIARGSFPSRLD